MSSPSFMESLQSNIAAAITPVTAPDSTPNSAAAPPATSPPLTPTPEVAPKLGAPPPIIEPSQVHTPPPTPSPKDAPKPEAPPVEGAKVEGEEEEEEEFKFSDEQREKAEAALKAEEAKKETPPSTESDEYAGDKIPRAELKKLEDAYLRTNRGRRAISALKTHIELEKDPSQGGIGFVPTAPQVKEFFQDHSDLRTMADEFYSGSPEKAANFLSQWFTPDDEGRIPKGAVAVAAQIPQVLAQHPDLYVQTAVPIVERYIDEMMSFAKSQPDKDARLYWTSVALGMRSHLRQEEIPKDELESIQKSLEAGPAPPPDPKTSEIDSKLKRIDDFEKRQRAIAFQSFQTKMEGEIDKGLSSDVQEALKTLKDKLPETYYTPIEEKLLREVKAKVKLNSPGLRNFSTLRDQARVSGNPADLAAAARAWRELARPIIKSLRLGYLRDAGTLMSQRSEERHQIASTAAGKAGSASVAQPVAQTPAASDIKRREGESTDEWLNRTVKALATGV